MQFRIKVNKQKNKDSVGEIKIGDFTETFDMATDYWTIFDYKRQWIDGLRRVVQGKDSSLITSLTDPKSANYIVWWPLYVRGSNVIVHNQLLFLDQLKQNFCIHDPYVHVPTYSNRNDDGDEIWNSSWAAADVDTLRKNNIDHHLMVDKTYEMTPMNKAGRKRAFLKDSSIPR